MHDTRPTKIVELTDGYAVKMLTYLTPRERRSIQQVYRDGQHPITLKDKDGNERQAMEFDKDVDWKGADALLNLVVLEISRSGKPVVLKEGQSKADFCLDEMTETAHGKLVDALNEIKPPDEKK